MIHQAQVFGQSLVDDSRATLARAFEALLNHFPQDRPPIGYLGGRTQMRNVIAEETGCSLHHAEQLVEELESAGYILYEGDTYAPEKLPASWTIDPAGWGKSGKQARSA